MKVYNQEKTFELSYYDLEKGYLVGDKLVVMHHEAKGAFDGVGHYKTTTYPNGGVDKEWIWDIPPSNAEDAWDETEDILVYLPFTKEEMEAKRADEIKARLAELSNDFAQVFAGAQISDIDARKREFAGLHNELRTLMGKTPRVYY
jgi:hypothetical protein